MQPAGGAVQNAEDFVLAHDEVFLAVQLDIAARVLPEEDAVADLHVQRNQLAILQALSLADSDDFAFLRLLFCGIRDEQPADGLLFCSRSVSQRCDHRAVECSYVEPPKLK